MFEARVLLESFGEAGASVRDPVPESGLCECDAGPTDLEIGLTGRVVIAENQDSSAALAIPLKGAKVRVWQMQSSLAAGGLTAEKRRRPAIWRRSSTSLPVRIGPEPMIVPFYTPVCLLTVTDAPAFDGEAVTVVADGGLSFIAAGFRVLPARKILGIQPVGEKPGEAATVWRYMVDPKDSGKSKTLVWDLNSIVAEQRWTLHRATSCARDGKKLVVEGVGVYRGTPKKFRLVLAEERGR